MHLSPKSDARISGRLTVALSALIAVLAAFLSIYSVSLSPPGFKARSIEIGVASRTVVVDTPNQILLRLSTNVDDVASLTDRADLIGNLIASEPVKAYIGRDAGIDPSEIDASAPVTANVPRSIIEPNSGSSATDILSSPDHYVLQIQADPTLPLLHIYAQAPSAAAALRLANGATTGLIKYLGTLGGQQGIPVAQSVKLVTVGPVTGGVINSGARIQIALLTLITAFAAAGLLIRLGSRVRLGWRLGGAYGPSAP